MYVYIVIFDKASLDIGSKLYSDIKQFIDDRYAEENYDYRSERSRSIRLFASKCSKSSDIDQAFACMPMQENSVCDSLDDRLKELDESFSQMLLRKIDEKGMTDAEVIDILHENDLINNKLFCKLFIKFFNKDGEYISGIYTLTPSLGVEKMISTMKTDFKSAETITLTFPEGWTIEQIAEKLETNEVCTASSFISTLQTVDFSDEYKFIKAIPDKEKRFRIMEGYIYPDTYEFYVGENASSVVRRFLNNFNSKWTAEYQEQAEARDLTVDEVIIMASIIQKEAANQKQMATISGILYNRVNEKPGAPSFLQCDSTEDYLLKTIKPKLTNSVEDTQKYLQYRDNYDTYSDACIGLPVGAIANPGDDAIKAALFPEETDYLYFRHDVEGGIYYANTLDVLIWNRYPKFHLKKFFITI